jgi:hypothetical protein
MPNPFSARYRAAERDAGGCQSRRERSDASPTTNAPTGACPATVPPGAAAGRRRRQA